MSNLKKFNELIETPRTQIFLESVLSEKKASFVNNLTALVANNVKLQECEPTSLMYAGIKATALDLPLDQNLGFAYVIPYKDYSTKKTEAQFQLGYKGFIQLAIRSGQFKTLNVTEIKDGEIKNIDLLSGNIELERIENRDISNTIGYIAYFKLNNGFEKSLYMTKSEIENHANKYSQSYSSKNEYVKKNSPWTTDFDLMAKKTVLKLLLSRYAPLSVEMQNAILSDQAVITEKGNEYVDNDTIDIDAVEQTCMTIDEAKEQISKAETKEQLNEVLKSASNLSTDNDFKNAIKERSQQLEKKENGN